MAEVSMAQIVEALAATYADGGIAWWLDRPHIELSEDRPIILCRTAEGRARVLELAKALQEAMD